MNNKIKEILDRLEGRKNWYLHQQKNNGVFNDEDYMAYMLLDYITNLQQENEYLKKQNDEKTRIGLADHKYSSQMEDKVIELQQENEKLKYKLKNKECLRNTRLDDDYVTIPKLKYKNITDLQIKTIKEKEDYKSRCEKASDKIKKIRENAIKYGADHDAVICNDLLNILQGENNDK